MVSKDAGRILFPLQVQGRRYERDYKCKLLIIVWLLIGGYCVGGLEFKKYICCIANILLAFILAEILHRLCTIGEEYYNLLSRYDSFLNMFQAVLSFNNIAVATIIVVVFSVSVMDWSLLLILRGIETRDIVSIYCIVGACYLYIREIKMESSTLSQARLFSEMKGMDYGSGMAFSFFYGYLNLILPRTGDERRGLIEQIINYESSHSGTQPINFPVKKLFILIPISGYCPTRVSEYSKCMESSSSLECRMMDRAGVRERVYHNSVYKLWTNDQTPPCYVCVEYASPLLTLYEVMSQNTPESRRYMKYQNEIITNFYTTLLQIINSSRNCSDLCELIFYKDFDDKNKRVDVGHVILERINQLIS